MKKTILLALWGLVTLAAWAEPAWLGYVTYAPQPVASTVAVQDNDLSWLVDTAALLPPEGFTFLGRRDADHWLALTKKANWLVVQVHDETARFNFRAQVWPKTGKVVVEKGVDWAGTDRVADASKATELAVTYLQRARLSEVLFPTAPAPAMAVTPAHDAPATAHDATTAMVAENTAVGNGGADLWQRLVDGNLRFVSGQVEHPRQDMVRIAETAKGQHPFAIVVSCSDSRVPPEILFDQGLGDLFVVRTAGEVVTDVELGSIEYAVEHLGATYLVVLGHKKCGAVDATLKGGELPPNIEAIAAQIRPAVEASRFFKGDPLDNAVRENAKTVLAKIKGTPALAEAFHEGKLNLKAAYYDIDTGKVAALP
jgi:carbonic anhydrase